MVEYAGNMLPIEVKSMREHSPKVYLKTFGECCFSYFCYKLFTFKLKNITIFICKA